MDGVVTLVKRQDANFMLFNNIDKKIIFSMEMEARNSLVVKKINNDGKVELDIYTKLVTPDESQ